MKTENDHPVAKLHENQAYFSKTNSRTKSITLYVMHK